MIAEQKLHDKIAAGLGNSRISPAVLATHMIKENVYVNESLLMYLTNYVIYMADSKLIPLNLVDIQNICKLLKVSLQELGLTGISELGEVDGNEYLTS